MEIKQIQMSPFTHSKDLQNHPEQSSLHWTRLPFWGQQACPTLPLALPAHYYMTANIINNSQANFWPNVQHYKYQNMIVSFPPHPHYHHLCWCCRKSRVTMGLSQGAVLIIEAEIHFHKLVNCWCIILHLRRRCFRSLRWDNKSILTC